MNKEDNGMLIKKKKISYKPVKPNIPSVGRIIITILVTILITFLLSLATILLYVKWIKYPPKEYIPENSTGIYCLNKWEDNIKFLQSDIEGSYVNKELSFANGDEKKITFYKKMLSTINYNPNLVNSKNIYGNLYINRDNNTVEELSSVKTGEVVNLSYIDYEKIEINKSILKGILTKYEISFNDIDYENKLVGVFCEYINNLSDSELPIKTIERIPDIDKSANNTYKVCLSEDEFIDKLLFSSKEFYDLLERFSEECAKLLGTKIYPNKDWVAWNELSDEDKDKIIEPEKYNHKVVASKTWCGAYYLENEYTTVSPEGDLKQGVEAEVGDGTINNPAGYNTSIITYVYVGEDEYYPIKVSLVEYGEAQDAINWFESKDTRNRGIDVKSQVQYCYCRFQVTNLSNKQLIIKDNSTLCDINANISARTGEIYGLKTEVVLNPDESGIIESWNKSTELNDKYLIWGKDFNRRCEPVWFKVLKGK